MMKVLLTFCCFVIPPSMLHYTWPHTECYVANVCNHTWLSVCGRDQYNNISTKVFMDECDMHEFNCVNRKSFSIVDGGNCLSNCTLNYDVLIDKPDHQMSKKVSDQTTPMTIKVSSTQNSDSNNSVTDEQTTTQATIGTKSTNGTFDEITTIARSTAQKANGTLRKGIPKFRSLKRHRRYSK